MSVFSTVEMAPRDPILGQSEQFNLDTRPVKANLGGGGYFDDAGRPPLLAWVQAAQRPMLSAPGPRGYLPRDGSAASDNAVKALVFGAGSEPVQSARVATVQAI